MEEIFEEEMARVRNVGGDVSSVKKRRPKTHLWGCEDVYGFGVGRSLPIENAQWRFGRSLLKDWNGF